MSSGNLVSTLQDYVTKILSIEAFNGMKALILDEHTIEVIAMVYSQTDIIAKRVFIVERIDDAKYDADVATDYKNTSSTTAQLTAVIFVRPVRESVERVCRMLQNPRYREYHIFFSNISGGTDDELLKMIAQADKMDLVRQVHEFFADYYAVTPSLFTCNVFDNVGMYEGKESWRARQRLSWSYTVDYLVSVLLSQRKNPIIRYQKKSAPCSLLAGELNSIVRSERELFNFGSAGNDSLLLILDRRDDPITPLLQNWTYHALVHENFQIKNNRVNMKSVPNIQKDLNEIVLSVHQDKFFREAMFLNYGELGSKVKQLAIEYQEKTKSTVKIDTIEDMKRFMDKYPEFKEFASNATKHIAIVSEIFRRTNSNALLKVSEVAQNLACTEDHSDATKSVTDLLNNPKVSFEHKLRVVMLYALRYETERNNKIALFKQTLRGLAGNDSESNRIRAVDEVLRISGDKSRGLTLYDNKGLMSAIADSFAAVAEVVGLKGMENVYTKHKPLFVQIVEQALKGRLDNAAFPAAGQQGNGKLDSVYVFVVGGATFAETYGMHSLSQANPNVKIFLGGSCIHNGKTYLDDLLGQGEGSKKDYNLEPLSIDISEQKDRSGTYSSPPGGDW